MVLVTFSLAKAVWKHAIQCSKITGENIKSVIVSTHFHLNGWRSSKLWDLAILDIVKEYQPVSSLLKAPVHSTDKPLNHLCHLKREPQE